MFALPKEYILCTFIFATDDRNVREYVAAYSLHEYLNVWTVVRSEARIVYLYTSVGPSQRTIDFWRRDWGMHSWEWQGGSAKRASQFIANARRPAGRLMQYHSALIGVFTVNDNENGIEIRDFRHAYTYVAVVR